jgi:hypothetical protein
MMKDQADWVSAIEDKPADQRTIAERRWQQPAKPKVAQLPADVGLFSDSASQLDLIEMLQAPTND